MAFGGRLKQRPGKARPDGRLRDAIGATVLRKERPVTEIGEEGWMKIDGQRPGGGSESGVLPRVRIGKAWHRHIKMHCTMISYYQLPVAGGAASASPVEHS